jgi:excisionase family DNA binding protein
MPEMPQADAVERLPVRRSSRTRQDELETYYTIREVAEHLNLHHNTVRRACWCGELPYKRVGRTVRIPKSAIEKWLGGRR